MSVSSVKLRGEATADLLRRYRDVFRFSWSQRDAMAPAKRLPHEAEFLPAALALQETPVSPAPRVAMWSIIAFAAIAAVWAGVGTIDIVATASGRIVPQSGSQVIQPVETATVRAIHVREGQAVHAGEALIELDARIAQADRSRAESELADARLLAARSRALLAALDGGKAPVLLPLPDVPVARRGEAEQLLRSQHQEYLARRSRLEAELARIDAEGQTTRETVRKLEQTLPLAERRAEDLKALADEQFVSRHTYLDREQARIERSTDLAALRSKLKEIEASRREALNQQAELLAQTRHTALDAITEGSQRATALEQELAKADTRGRLLQLTAPVDGTVQQLAVRTVGGVVTPAQQVMVIVPKDGTLEVEAYVENKDIGFVRAGQRAVVKVETFPYTRYGTIDGEILSVSHDAIADDKRGLIYAMRVRLARRTMDVDGVDVSLSPGMAVSVEARLGERRLIEYFLSPFLRATSESLRER